MGTGKLSTAGWTTSTHSCSLPSLSGGGQVKYPPKARQERSRNRTQDPLASLPLQVQHGRHSQGSRHDARYVTRSVPVHTARRKKDEERESNSAPMETSRHHTNHDRQPRSRMPRLPKINNLLNEPMQQQIHGTSTVTEAGRKDQGGKRWASSWADARANSSTVGETRAISHRPASDSDHSDKVGQAKEVGSNSSSPITSSSPRISNGASPKSPKETEEKVPVKGTGVKRTDVLEPKTKRSLTASSKTSALKESKCKDDKCTQSSSQIETKTLQSRSKSSSVLTSQQDTTRQNSEIISAYSSESSPRKNIPQVRVSTVSRGSRSTSTTLRSKLQPTQQKRFRKPVIITRKSVIKQKTLQSVYGNKSFKFQRQVRVLQRMEQIQRKEVEEFNQDLMDKEKYRMDSIVRQRMALKRVRDRFDEEQVRRFRNQYVSWKSVEEDRLNRSSEQYGLPDFIYEDRYERTLKKIPESNATPSSSKSLKKFQKYATWVRNIKVFEKLLNPKVGSNLEEAFQTKQKLIVEGIDTVKLDNDDPKCAKKVNVKRLIGSAKKLLNVTENMGDISEVSSYQEDELSDDDDGSLDLSDDDDDDDDQ